MVSTDLDDRPRRRLGWSTVLVVVLLVAAVGIVFRVVQDGDTVGRDPVIDTVAPPSAEPTDVVHGTLTLTDDCFSVPQGLVVWPPGTTWDAKTQIVHITTEAADVAVGDNLVQLATTTSDLPTVVGDGVDQTTLDAITACSRRTGITSVVFVG